MTYPIVIPLHHSGGKLRNNTELRFAIRSLAAHFKDGYTLAIVGKRIPDWLEGVEHIVSNQGLKSALKDAAARFPDGFFWWYDDLTLLQDITGEEMKATPACKGWSKAQTGWARSLTKIKDRLTKEGYTPWDYSRPHGPYWFDKSMVDEGFRDWPGMKSKFPWESWILSKRDWPRRFGVVKQYYGTNFTPPGDHAVFLNYNDRGNTPDMRAWLAARFTAPCQFETQTEDADEADTAAKVRFRIKGEGDGPVYQGQKIVKQCGACNKSTHNKTIHFVWIGASLMPLECEEIMQEWKDLHPDFTFKFWDEAAVAKCEYVSSNVRDTNLPAIMRADLLRLEIMANEGGVYTDLDIRPYKNCWGIFQLVTDFCYSDEMHGRSINAIFFSKGKSRTAQAIRDHIGDISTKQADCVIKSTGPEAVQNALNQICDYSNPEIIPNIGRRYGDIIRLDIGVYLASTVKKTRKAFMSGAIKKGYQYGVHLYASTWYPPHKRKWKPRQLSENMNATFDIDKYELSGETDWAMDDRHIYMLHQEAISDFQGDRVAVEIGSHKGRSTTALIEALNSGKLTHLHIVEIDVKKELLEVLKKVEDQTKLTIHTTPACNASIYQADFVFIDGSHDWWAVSDALRALVWGAKVICLHDTSAFPRMKNCWGSHHAAEALKIAKGRSWKEDSIDRKGEHTWRGFGVSRLIEP